MTVYRREELDALGAADADPRHSLVGGATTMIKPMIRQSGTARVVLAGQIDAAAAALRAGVVALQQAAPHARDYPGERAYRVAEREHASRVARVQDVLDELFAIRCHVEDEAGADADGPFEGTIVRGDGRTVRVVVPED